MQADRSDIYPFLSCFWLQTHDVHVFAASGLFNKRNKHQSWCNTPMYFICLVKDNHVDFPWKDFCLQEMCPMYCLPVMIRLYFKYCCLLNNHILGHLPNRCKIFLWKATVQVLTENFYMKLDYAQYTYVNTIILYYKVSLAKPVTYCKVFYPNVTHSLSFVIWQ